MRYLKCRPKFVHSYSPSSDTFRAYPWYQVDFNTFPTSQIFCFWKFWFFRTFFLIFRSDWVLKTCSERFGTCFQPFSVQAEIVEKSWISTLPERYDQLFSCTLLLERSLCKEKQIEGTLTKYGHIRYVLACLSGPKLECLVFFNILELPNRT